MISLNFVSNPFKTSWSSNVVFNIGKLIIYIKFFMIMVIIHNMEQDILEKKFMKLTGYK